MLEYYYKGDVLETIQKVISKVEGSYALGIICADCPDRIFAVRKLSLIHIFCAQPYLRDYERERVDRYFPRRALWIDI